MYVCVCVKVKVKVKVKKDLIVRPQTHTKSSQSHNAIIAHLSNKNMAKHTAGRLFCEYRMLYTQN